MRVLIAPDKFMGTLTARQAAAAMARGWKGVRPGDELTLLSLSDGGDGFGQVLAGFCNALRVRTVTGDVRNRLLGAQGCTRVYGPQKGLRAGDFPRAEAGLRRLAEVVRGAMGRDVAAEAGSGAAGGLGFGLVAFVGALTNLTPPDAAMASASFWLEKLTAETARQFSRRGVNLAGDYRAPIFPS